MLQKPWADCEGADLTDCDLPFFTIDQRFDSRRAALVDAERGSLRSSRGSSKGISRRYSWSMPVWNDRNYKLIFIILITLGNVMSYWYTLFTLHHLQIQYGPRIANFAIWVRYSDSDLLGVRYPNTHSSLFSSLFKFGFWPIANGTQIANC